MIITRLGRRRQAAFFSTATAFSPSTAIPANACRLTACSENWKNFHRQVRSIRGFNARNKKIQAFDPPTQAAKPAAIPQRPTAAAPKAVAEAAPRPAPSSVIAPTGLDEVDEIFMSSAHQRGNLRAANPPIPLMDHYLPRQLAQEVPPLLGAEQSNNLFCELFVCVSGEHADVAFPEESLRLSNRSRDRSPPGAQKIENFSRPPGAVIQTVFQRTDTYIGTAERPWIVFVAYPTGRRNPVFNGHLFCKRHSGFRRAAYHQENRSRNLTKHCAKNTHLAAHISITHGHNERRVFRQEKPLPCQLFVARLNVVGWSSVR